MTTMTTEHRPHRPRPPDELKLARRLSRRQGLFAPDLLKAALRQSFVMLRPDILWKNPVMFVVEVGTVLSIVFTVVKVDRPGLDAGLARLPDRARRLAVPDGPVRQLRRGAGRGPRQGPGRRPAQDAAGHAGASGCRSRHVDVAAARCASAPRSGVRGDGLHRLCRPATSSSSRPARSSPATARSSRGSPRSTSRPSPASRPRSSARPAATAPASPAARASSPTASSSAITAGAGQVVPRPHDRPGRRGGPPADAQRDRPVARAGRVHADLPDRHRDALADGRARRSST